MGIFTLVLEGFCLTGGSNMYDNIFQRLRKGNKLVMKQKLDVEEQISNIQN